MAKRNYFEQQNIDKFNKLQVIINTLPSFFGDYFVFKAPTTSVSTRLNYARDLQIFCDYLSRPEKLNKMVKDFTINDFKGITTFDIEYFLSYLTSFFYNKTSRSNYECAKARKLSSIRSLFKFLYTRDFLTNDVSAKIGTPKLYTKEIVRLDRDEMFELLDNAEKEKKFESVHKNKYNLKTRDRDIAILTLLLGTGIRVSELVGIDLTDIDLPKKTFIVTRKGGNRAYLYFSEDVEIALDNWIFEREKILRAANKLNETALFLSLQKKRLCVRAVENIVKKYAATVTTIKTISPHKLRSSFGTALYQETNDIYVVAEVLGHKDVNTTKKHYAAISEDIKRKASKKIKLR